MTRYLILLLLLGCNAAPAPCTLESLPKHDLDRLACSFYLDMSDELAARFGEDPALMRKKLCQVPCAKNGVSDKRCEGL